MPRLVWNRSGIVKKTLYSGPHSDYNRTLVGRCAMFLLYFLLWIVFNGRVTLEICLFGLAIAGALLDRKSVV